ncbi:MAG: hypothetical protein IPF47_23055 [Gemmatimonadetes bacterium]|nr:hypothetical protein [Gemmatimonadota bacterium]
MSRRDSARPLLAVDGVDWHLLQPGVPPDAVPLPPGTESTAHALPPVRHFGDTAFILRQLDLVITVDTAVANLSAALGIPTRSRSPRFPSSAGPSAPTARPGIRRRGSSVAPTRGTGPQSGTRWPYNCGSASPPGSMQTSPTIAASSSHDQRSAAG